MRHLTALFISFALAAANVGWAQEVRGSITGQVLDPDGAVIPGATVTITNADTNTTSRTQSNATGYFEASLLNPGTYAVAVEVSGFKKSVRSGLELSVGGRLDIEIRMQLGAVAETLEVTAAAPILDTTTASGGRVIGNRDIMQLPVKDMNPFTLAGQAAGMQWTGTFTENRRQFDLAGTSSASAMGGVGQNEYTVDGASVTGTDRRVAFVPPPDAVEEFKLEITPFDASYGHTSGAVVNVMTKAGTNVYHGSLYDQHQQQRWNATKHFTRLAFEDAVRRGKSKPGDPKQPSGRSNNFGGTLGGPLRIPKIYNGRDKLFFSVIYYALYDQKPQALAAQNFTVPKMAWRQGNFSDLQAIDAVKYTVYDPRSARLAGNRVVRTPFPGNQGVPVLNPLYKFYSPLYPKPNDVPGLVSPEGTNNYLAVGIKSASHFNSIVNRYDYNISDRHRLFGRWYWNQWLNQNADWTYETSPGLQNTGQTRMNKGAGATYLWIINNNDTLDISASLGRFGEGNRRPEQTKFKPSDVGLPAYLDAQAGPYHVLPQVNPGGGLASVGLAYPGMTALTTTGQLKVSLNSIRGAHSLKYGWEERRYWEASASPGFSSGRFNFDRTYTRAADNTTTASDLGLGWAAFMMAAPSTINIANNDSGYWSTRYRALFIQDDWRISKRFRLMPGLRYEREGGITERFNRGIAGGFLFDAKLPFTDAAQAAYAKNPLAELPASQFRAVGGTEYLGARHKTFTDGTHLLLPRIGAVYLLDKKTVLRGGYGWYYDTLNVDNTRPNQTGYSQPTDTPFSNDNGLTFCCGIGAAGNLGAGRNPFLDPFPVRSDGTRFNAPYGNTLGLVALRSASFIPRDFTPDWQQRWRISMQREINRNTALEVSYNGAYAKIFVPQPVSYLPAQYWATGTTRNQAVDDDLTRNVPNPFYIGNLSDLQKSAPALYGYLQSQSFFTSATIRKNQLLRAFPQMNGLSGVRPDSSFSAARGGNRYHDVQVQLERRFTRGFQSTLMYTHATGEVQDNYYQDFDAAPSWRPNNNVRPNRLVWTAVVELPFGRGRTWLQKGLLQHFVGGWQLSWVYENQSGPSTEWANRFYYGDLAKMGDLFQHDQTHSRDIHAWFDPSIAFRGSGPIPQGFQGFEGRAAMQPGQFQARAFPTRLDSLRADGYRNWDAKVLRRFRITERLRTTFSADLLNLTNHTNFDAPNVDPTSPNFGKVTAQIASSRVIQINLRVDF